MLALMLASLAQAGETGHFHPPELAARSALYAQASEASGARFRDAQSNLEAVATALLDYQVALDLLGDRAPAAERERLTELRTRFNRERAVLQAFANTMIEDFDNEFGEAMSRALPEGAVSCPPTIADGPSLPGIPAATRPNPACKGADLNDSIAEAMDADPQLRSAIEEILALEWPTITLDDSPQAVLGGGDAWIGVSPWFETAVPGRLKAIDRADAEARLPFEAAIEQGADKEALAELVREARAVTAKTAASRASLAAPVFSVSDAWMSKRAKKGKATAGWCANPALFGGCAGQDVTEDVGGELLAWKKTAKVIGR